jgi:hypothetical protein
MISSGKQDARKVERVQGLGIKNGDNKGADTREKIDERPKKV